MKNLKYILVMLAVICAVSLASRADDSTNAPVKPYPLKTCLVCDMQLGDMGKPFVFVYKGQEIELCDKSEKPEFDKNADKYMKKLADEAAKMKK
jgi:hypothetical protein